MTRWLAVLLLFAVSACTGDNSDDSTRLPDPAQLLQHSADSMRQVETVRFKLTVDGQIKGISISSAQGQLTKAGNVKGSAVLTSGGQPAEAEFVIVGDTLYLKGPTGGFQKLPSSFAATVYDPTKILDVNLGLAALVAGATEPLMAGRDSAEGVDAYKVGVKFAKNNLGVLLPGAGASTDLPGELWIAAAEPNRPVKARVTVPPAPGTAGGTVTIMLSEFNNPVTVEPPA